MVRKAFIAIILVLVCCITAVHAGDGSGFTPIDISSQANRGFVDGPAFGVVGWSNQGLNNMSEFPVGKQVMLGVPFNVISPRDNKGKTCLVLKQTGNDKDCPTKFIIKVPGIKAKTLYFLHTATWGIPNTVAGEYRIHHQEVVGAGPISSIPIETSKNIDDFYLPGGLSDLPQAALGWKGKNAQKDPIGVFVMPWKNPYPDMPITEIEFSVTGNSGVQPILIAITASDQGLSREIESRSSVAGTLFEMKSLQDVEKIKAVLGNSDCYSVDTNNRKNSDFSLKVIPGRSLSSPAFPFTGGTLRVSGWYKYADISFDDKITGDIWSSIHVVPMDNVGKQVAVHQDTSAYIKRGSGDWTYFESDHTFPDNTAFVKFDMSPFWVPNGTIWFSDIKVEQIKSLTKRTKPVETNMANLKSEKIAVFREEGFPRVGMPEAATPEFIADTLKEAGYDVDFVDINKLSNPNTLNVNLYNTLILSYGEAVPGVALNNIRDFVADGGGLISPAGKPLGTTVIRGTDGKWQMLPSAGMVQTEIAPVAQIMEAPRKPIAALMFDRAYLPGLPEVWPLSGGTVSMSPLDWKGWLPSNTMMGTHRLLGSMDERGSLVGLPLWFNSGRQLSPAAGTSPCARYLFLGFEGESHPWNPKAWGYAKTAIKDMVDIVATRNHLIVYTIDGPAPIEPDAKEVAFSTSLMTPLPVDADVEIDVRGRDTGKSIYHETRRVHLRASVIESWKTANNVVFTVKNPDLANDWAFDVFVKATPVGQKKCYPAYDFNLFVKRSDENAKSAPALLMDPTGRYLTFGGKPWWGYGFNGGSYDTRVHFNPCGYLGPIDRQISETKAMNGDNLRVFFWALLGPGFEKDKGTMYAYNSLMARTGILNEVGYFQQTQNEWKSYPEIAAIWDKEDPWVGPTWSYIYNKFNLRFNQANADFKNILIYPYNENTYFHVQGALPTDPNVQFLQWAENMERFNLTFDHTVKEASGYPRVTCSEMGSVTYPFQTPRVGEGPLDMTSIHIYGNETLKYMDGKHDLAFNLNYGKPCWIGESMSMEGGWQDNLFGVFMAEMGTGISFHVYRGDGWPWWSRWDEIFTERCIDTKMWGLLLKHILPSDYKPLDTVLLFDDREDLRAAGASGFPVDDKFDANDRIETRGSGPDKVRQSRFMLDKQYNQLLKRGIYAQILTPEQLVSYPGKVRNIILASNFVTSPHGIDMLNRTSSSGKVKVFAGGDSVPSGLTNVRPASELANLGRKDVTYEGQQPQYFYIRDKVDGGRTIILTGASGKYTFTVDGRTKIACEVPDGRAIVIDLSSKNQVVLYKGYGSLIVNGKAVITAKSDPDLAYLVFSRDRRSISSSNELSMFCEDQSAVKLAHMPSNSVAALRKVTVVCSSSDYRILASRVAKNLKSKGLSVNIADAGSLTPAERKNNLVIIGVDPAKPGLAQKVMAGRSGIKLVSGCWRDSVLIGKARLNWLYDGFISSYENPWSKGRKAIVIGGVNVPGLRMAVQRFEHLSILGSYSTGIFSPQDL